ncbi:scd6-like sm domain-containing protein [Ditylenchus destructor]|nr:scd6-like sm domain-containing protein [Ditylenchus destructor]
MVSNSSHKMPYIGCKVSVVSKLGIRYEGVLYSVDCTQASILLVKGDSVENVVKEERVMEKCYDKNKSFFDHISSEIRDKENGKSFRTHWRKESLINRETFGQSTVNRNPPSRRTFGGAREYHGSNVRRGMGRPGMTVRPREWVSSPFRYTINRHGNAF